MNAIILQHLAKAEEDALAANSPCSEYTLQLTAIIADLDDAALENLRAEVILYEMIPASTAVN